MLDSHYFIGYNRKTMSWWRMITTKGRLLTNICLAYTQEEIRIYGLRLEEGEEPAILIDTYHNRARIYAPFDECQMLASLHQYELFIRRQPEETFTSHVERLLSLKNPKAQTASPPEGEQAQAAASNVDMITTQP